MKTLAHAACLTTTTPPRFLSLSPQLTSWIIVGWVWSIYWGYLIAFHST